MVANSTGQMGRPRKIQTPELFDALVDMYVIERAALGKPLSPTSLTLYLGFRSVSSLSDYGKRKGFEEFASSVKRARLIVEDSWVDRAISSGGGVAGVIFLLKASYGYEDKKTVDVNATGDINVTISEKAAQL